MPIDRNAAVEYARKYWNRVTDDDKFWTSNAVVSLPDKRRTMKAPASDGWEAFFVSDGAVGESAVFQRTVGGKTETQPDAIATWNLLDDCTHYVSRCLIKQGIKLTETPRANELAEAMIRSSQTKTLAVKCTRNEGQKVIDSGVFKPGDLVAYYTEGKNRYTHTAMFVGHQTSRADDPGGITCHTVCRFQGLTKDWNGATDDDWFLHDGPSYTLIHFSADDTGISMATLKWLPGWWKVAAGYYYVTSDGHAYLTHTRPVHAKHKLFSSHSVGYYFETGRDVVFIWRQPRGRVLVERWTAPAMNMAAAMTINGLGSSLTRMF